MLDDDDLLLGVPQHPVQKGLQYLPLECTDEMTNARVTYANFAAECEVVTDFSGYTLLGAHFKEYFEHWKPNDGLFADMINSLEDTNFMKFVDAKGAQEPDVPQVFHRLWEILHHWRTNFDNIAEGLGCSWKKSIILNLLSLHQK